MCRAAASVLRAASAAQTQESMPPLNNTTERGFSPATNDPLLCGNLYVFRWYGSRNSCPLYFLIIAKLQRSSRVTATAAPASNAFGRRLPDEFMELQSQAD